VLLPYEFRKCASDPVDERRLLGDRASSVGQSYMHAVRSGTCSDHLTGEIRAAAPHHSIKIYKMTRLTYLFCPSPAGSETFLNLIAADDWEVWADNLCIQFQSGSLYII